MTERDKGESHADACDLDARLNEQFMQSSCSSRESGVWVNRRQAYVTDVGWASGTWGRKWEKSSKLFFKL